jgi:hypothetical protein
MPARPAEATPSTARIHLEGAMTDVSVLGLGAMGSALALHVLRRRHVLTGPVA